jgi:hypothetical protein
MGHFNGDRPAVVQIGGAIDGRHAAARHQFLDAIVTELVAGTQYRHGDYRSANGITDILRDADHRPILKGEA